MTGLAEFFRASDGLTVSATLIPTGLVLTGFFDVTGSEFYMDDSEGPERAQFVCEQWSESAGFVGETLAVDGDNYRINKIQPDGTGLVTLHLLEA